MAYKPSLADIPQTQSYKPSLADIPIDQDKVPQYQWRPSGTFTPTNPAAQQQSQEAGQNALEGFKGSIKGLGNTPFEIANIFRKQPKPLPFPYKNEAQQTGGLASDLYTFNAPSFLTKLGVKGLTHAPLIGKGANALLKAAQNTPWLKNALSLAGAGANAGVYGERKNPNESMEDLIFNTGMGVGTQTLSNLIPSKNSLVSYGAKAGLGSLLGQQFGHPYYGAMVGTAIGPLAAMFLGKSKNALAEEALTGLQPKDVMRSAQANERLGTSVTPAQASGNYPKAAQEGSLKRSPEGAQISYRLENRQMRQQNQAVNRLLDTVYKSTPQKEKEISDAYAKANQTNLPPSVITTMRQDPILNDAFSTVEKDPAFAHLPNNNYEFLAEVERQLYRDQQAAYRNPLTANRAHHYGTVKNIFSNMLEKNTDYALAKQLAKPRIIRRQMEEKLNQEPEDYTAKTFYKKFLTKRSDYSDVLHDTKNNPAAQQKLKDMRVGWKHLSNMKTVSQASEQSSSGISQARDIAQGMLENLNKVAKGRGDIQSLKYIHGGDWHNDFDKLMQIKDQAERNKKLLTFFGRLANIYEIQTDALRD